MDAQRKKSSPDGLFPLVAVIAAVLAGPGAGCRFPEFLGDRSRVTVNVGLKATDPVPPDQAVTGDRAVDGDCRPTLALDAWVIRVPGSGGIVSPRLPRWRHAKLEDLIARPAEELPDLARWLDDRDPIVAGNAAICLARLGRGAPASRLAATVRQPALKWAMRAAAAEALGQLPRSTSVPLLRELLTQYGGGPRRTGSSYSPELHAELIRALGRLVSADSESPLRDALGAPVARVRLEALRAWPRSGSTVLPMAVIQACQDPDPRVRAEAFRVVIARRPDAARETIDQALRDENLAVRLAAVTSLGQLHDGRAREAARRLLDHRNEKIRAAAVTSLAAMGAGTDLLPAVADRSRCVRRAVASALRHWRDVRAVAVARRLVADSSSQVACQAVAALRDWPLERAAPVLLDALGANGYLVRKEAAAQLSRRWPPAHDFPAGGKHAERNRMLAALRTQWATRAGVGPAAVRGASGRLAEGPPATMPVAGHADHAVEPLPVKLRNRLKVDLEKLALRQTSPADRRQIEQQLVQLGPPLVAALAAVVRETAQPLPTAVYHDVLPRVDATFDLLARLESSDVGVRRRAAGTLARRDRKAPLGDLALRRLETLIVPEADANVWWNIEIALTNDRRDAVARIHLAALSHPAPEVRRRACEYLAALGDPRHTRALLATLGDSNPAVVRAAVEALGTIGRSHGSTSPEHPDDHHDGQPNPGSARTVETADCPVSSIRQALEPLLASDDPLLRLAVARALADLKYEPGSAALERLACHGDPSIRRRAAQAMGQLGNPAFTPSLIRLLDDRLAVRKAALASLRKIHGHGHADGAADPWFGQADASLGLDERISRWKQWYIAGMPAKAFLDSPLRHR